METFLIICKEVIYSAKQQALDLQDPKIKKALCYSIQKQLAIYG